MWGSLGTWSEGGGSKPVLEAGFPEGDNCLLAPNGGLGYCRIGQCVETPVRGSVRLPVILLRHKVNRMHHIKEFISGISNSFCNALLDNLNQKDSQLDIAWQIYFIGPLNRKPSAWEKTCLCLSSDNVLLVTPKAEVSDSWPDRPDSRQESVGISSC
jgi:hypothetical protein